MGSTMRFWKNAANRNGIGNHFPALALIAALLLATGIALGDDGIAVEYASSGRDDSSLLLDARFRFRFDDEIYEALQHGVELHITVNVQIRRERKWLWDAVIADQSLEFVLHHHPLTDDFAVTDGQTGVRRQFPDVQEALTYLGTIHGRPILPLQELDPEARYSGRIKARLNIENLPAPLQPVAYVSRKWRIESQWYRWEVR